MSGFKIKQTSNSFQTQITPVIGNKVLENNVQVTAGGDRSYY